MMFNLNLISFLFLLGRISCELFSLTEELIDLALKQESLVVELKSFAAELEEHVKFIRRKVKSYESEQELISQDVERYVSIPLNAFRLIKIFTNDSSSIKDKIHGCAEKFSQKIRKLSSTSYSDLQGAIEGIARLQDVYKFKTEDFVKGIINGDDYNTTLSTHDIFIIGTELLKQSRFPEAIKYLNESSLKKTNTPDDSLTEVSHAEILFALIDAHDGNESFSEALKVFDVLAKLEPENQEVIAKREMFLQLRKEELTMHKQKAQLLQPLEIILTKKVCNDEIHLSETIKSKLRCRYISTNHFTFLAPFKQEEAYLDPRIVLFHDVISSREIDFLKNLSKPFLGHSVIFAAQGVQKKQTETRISKVAWFKDSVDPAIAKISKRVEDMTGLTTSTAEELQIQHYGIAGFYKSHYDFMGEKSTFKNGDRTATVLFYMNDVEKGGATVFPYIKVRLTTRKGSAAFWHNLHQSGYGDFRTRHSGCPILVGSKWVANKWIHQHGQEFRRSCNLEHVTTDELSIMREFKQKNSDDLK